MAQQTIDIGSSPNDGTGDPLRTAFDKANDNFDELYALFAALGSASDVDIDTDGTMAANSDTKVASQKATRTYVAAAIAALINSAPGALDTLDELAAALGDDANFASTVTTALAGKLALTGGTLTGDLHVPDDAYNSTTWNGSDKVPTKNAVRDAIEAIIAGIPGSYTDEQAQDATGSMVDGTLTYVDATPSLGINTTSEAERIRDVIGATLVQGSNVTITVDDAGDTITIAATGGGGTGGGGPAGRLTLVSGTPVLASDQTAKTSVYYTPYVGNTIPLYDGTNTTSSTFAELTLSLDTTNHASGNLYDVFVWNDSGTIKIGTGPAWSSTTARGTGAGTTELEMKNGFWTNKVSITLKNGAGSGITGVAANRALYVGTIYATANGQTGVALQPAAASGGGNPIVGIWNAYNRVKASSSSMESATGYGYNTGTWHPVNGSNNNRVTTIDGLAQTHVKARHLHGGFTSAAGGRPNIGINRDSTTATPRMLAWVSGTGSTLHQFVTEDNFLPSLGLHYYQAMELGSAGNGGSGSMTWGLTGGQILLVEYDF